MMKFWPDLEDGECPCTSLSHDNVSYIPIISGPASSYRMKRNLIHSATNMCRPACIEDFQWLIKDPARYCFEHLYTIDGCEYCSSLES